METKERTRLHKLIKVLGIAALILLSGALCLGVSTARYMKGIIRNQFTEQQLVLARATARMIETSLQNAIADLIQLNALPAIHHGDQIAAKGLLLSTFPVLSRDNIMKIRRVDKHGMTLFTADEQGIDFKRSNEVPPEMMAHLAWASHEDNHGKVMVTPIREMTLTDNNAAMAMDLLIPTYEDSTESPPLQTSGRFSGYLFATLNITDLLGRIISPIKPGRTGYAWVLDSSGRFLYHPETSFIGEDAFIVGSDRNIDTSLTGIHSIQRTEMFKGKEGTGIYLSGWHRTQSEPLEKFLAYTPVNITAAPAEHVWSVAVLVPVHEIEGIINGVYLRQMKLQGLIVLIILMGSGAIVLYERRWSATLEQEVALKTEDMQRYANELKRSEGKYRSLVESAEDLIFTIDGNGRIRTANEYMCRLFDTGANDLVGRDLYSMLPRQEAEAQLNVVREVLQNGKGSKLETLVRVGSRERWFNLQYIPLKGDESGIDLILSIGRDITQRRSMEKQLIKAEKLASLGTLAAGVAHEMNNPLGIILGFCDLLLEKTDPESPEYNDLKTIERHGLQCKNVVDRLLFFATNGQEPEEYCCMNERVETALSLTQHDFTQHGIQLELCLAADLPLVRGESSRIQKVFLNLISNAIGAMHGGGVFSVSTRSAQNGGWVEVKMSDTGTGIHQEFIPHIFDPFFSTKEVGKGAGLGLSESYGIVSQCGGTIECESHSLEDPTGEPGTTFIIRLPAYDASSHQAPREHRSAPPASPSALS